MFIPHYICNKWILLLDIILNWLLIKKKNLNTVTQPGYLVTIRCLELRLSRAIYSFSNRKSTVKWKISTKTKNMCNMRRRVLHVFTNLRNQKSNNHCLRSTGLDTTHWECILNLKYARCVWFVMHHICDRGTRCNVN